MSCSSHIAALLVAKDVIVLILAVGWARGFLLGPWLEDAKSAATTEEEAARFEWNMRTQISIWGTSQDGGSEIEDYANRQWGGLMHSYHRRRCAELECLASTSAPSSVVPHINALNTEMSYEGEQNGPQRALHKPLEHPYIPSLR